MTVNNDAEEDAWEIVSDLLSDAYENFEKAGDEEMAESLHKAFDAMEKDENNSWHIVFANRVHERSKNYMKQPINKVMLGTFMTSFWVMRYAPIMRRDSLLPGRKPIHSNSQLSKP